MVMAMWRESIRHGEPTAVLPNNVYRSSYRRSSDSSRSARHPGTPLVLMTSQPALGRHVYTQGTGRRCSSVRWQRMDYASQPSVWQAIAPSYPATATINPPPKIIFSVSMSARDDLLPIEVRSVDRSHRWSLPNLTSRRRTFGAVRS